ncbi:MAG: flagellar protein FliT [Blautia sp.]|nr:flagellar protein FliT [Lachnoclostridium sp.]MCM1210212.1 flagellar protein FliT [Blautia sp.]
MSQNSAQILLQSLEKKNAVLDAIIEQNSIQEELLKSDNPDMDALDVSIERIGEFVEELDRLDEGFELLYERMRSELMANRTAYKTEIAGMQEQIQQITDKVVTINAAKMRNQMRAENFFKQKSKDIKNAVSKTNAAKNYYNNMNKLNFVAPQFYDNKK